MLDVDALDRADALGEVEHLGLAERLGDVPALALLVDDRRVQALLDRRPDRERRREVVPGDDEVRPVAHAQLVDLVEQLVLRVAGEDVRQARLHPDADERQAPGILPLLLLGELCVAEFDAHLFVGAFRMPLRQAHRHVEVRRAGREGAVEDRHDEPRVDGVEHMGGGVLADQGCHGLGARGIHLRRGEPLVAEFRHERFGAGRVVVGDDDGLEEVAAAEDAGGGTADAAGADDEDAHAGSFRAVRCRRRWSGGGCSCRRGRARGSRG